jgi:cell wall-associated NlpC family hydrolase
MPTRHSRSQPADRRAVPSLKIAPGLQSAAEPGGGAIGLTSSSRLRVGAVALAATVVIAGAVFMLTRGLSRDHPSPRSPALPLAAYLPRVHTLPIATGADRASAAGGVRLTVVDASPPPRPPAPKAPPPGPLQLSTSQLLATSDGSSPFTPAPYLVTAFESAAHSVGIPWRLLAAIEYVDGRDSLALAGVSAQPARSIEVRPGVLADAVAASRQPSPALLADARRLAADGAASSAATAVATYTHGDPSVSEVLTVAQQIDSSALSSSSGPLAKVVAMQGEARLLNGLPYVWGGGHSEPAWVVSGGYDCSGFVSEVLHSAGYLSSPDTTQTLPGSAGIVSGPGRYVSIYDRTIATVRVWVKRKKMVTVRKAVNPATIGVHVDKRRQPDSETSVSIRLPRSVGEWKTVKVTKLVRSADTTNNDEHVIIDLDGQWWESGGSSADGGAAMVHRIVDPSQSYLKSFNRILHPAGM